MVAAIGVESISYVCVLGGPLKILAIDTATARGSVALVADGQIEGEVRLRAPEGHSRHLLGAVAFLLESLGWAPSQVEGFAVCAGPGSFTGLRVGLSTVQGLALASGRPCLGLPTLDVLAQRIRGAAPTLVALMDAFRGEVFGRLYDREARPLGQAHSEAPDAFLSRVEGEAAFIGDGVVKYRACVQARHPQALQPERELYLAGTLGRMAEARFAAGLGVAPERLRPIYLREAQIRKSER